MLSKRFQALSEDIHEASKDVEEFRVAIKRILKSFERVSRRFRVFQIVSGFPKG